MNQAIGSLMLLLGYLPCVVLPTCQETLMESCLDSETVREMIKTKAVLDTMHKHLVSLKTEYRD